MRIYGFKIFRRNQDAGLMSVTPPAPHTCARAEFASDDVYWYRCPYGIRHSMDHRCENCELWQRAIYIPGEWSLSPVNAPFAVFASSKDAWDFFNSLCPTRDSPEELWLVLYDEIRSSPDWNKGKFAIGTVFASRVKPIMKLDTGEEE